MNSIEFKAAQDTYLRAVHVFAHAQYARRHGRISGLAFKAEEQRFTLATEAYEFAVHDNKKEAPST